MGQWTMVLWTHCFKMLTNEATDYIMQLLATIRNLTTQKHSCTVLFHCHAKWHTQVCAVLGSTLISLTLAQSDSERVEKTLFVNM